MKYFIYCRRSQDRDDRQVLSIEDQRRELLDTAAKNNLTVVDVYEESRSAYKKGRPKFNEMLDRMEKDEADGLLVWHLTRIARNSYDGGRVIYMMDEGYIKEIRTINKSYYDDPNDKFILTIEFGMAKKSSDDTSQFVKRDIRGKMEKGEYPSMAPLGYINLDNEGRIAGKSYDAAKQKYFMELAETRPLERVEIDPVVGPLVKKLFHWVAFSHLSLKEARDKGFEAGLRGQRNRGLSLNVES
jgi:site-specific DNA recombinase